MSNFTKAYTKKEVAQMLNISAGTLRYWLNTLYIKELERIGYVRNQKLLTPKQLNFLQNKLDLTETDKI